MLFRIEQGNGLGDAVMLTAVLRTLRAQHAGCRIELVVNPGREGLYDLLADEVTNADPSRPPTHRLRWLFPRESFRDLPSNFAARCLVEEFGMPPLPGYWSPVVHVPSALRSVWQSKKIALVHFSGCAMRARKDISPSDAAEICAMLTAAGYEVQSLNAPNAQRLTPDALQLAARIAAADLFLGCDSGPLHLASAVGTPAIGLWRLTHPLHHFCPDETTIHLQLDYGEPATFLIWPPAADGLAFYRAHYRYRRCLNFAQGLRELLPGLIVSPEARRWGTEKGLVGTV